MQDSCITVPVQPHEDTFLCRSSIWIFYHFHSEVCFNLSAAEDLNSLGSDIAGLKVHRKSMLGLNGCNFSDIKNILSKFCRIVLFCIVLTKGILFPFSEKIILWLALYVHHNMIKGIIHHGNILPGILYINLCHPFFKVSRNWFWVILPWTWHTQVTCCFTKVLSQSVHMEYRNFL